MGVKKNSAGHTVAYILAAVVIIAIMIIFSQNRGRILEETSVEIPKGSSIVDISQILKDEDVISGRLSFIVRTVISGKSGQLKYGTFDFLPGESYSEIIEKMCNSGAKRETVTITIPEGYSVEMIIDKVTKEGISTKEEFELALEKEYNYEFLNYVDKNPERKYILQGYLFPSTYEFFKDAKAEDVINAMLLEFEKQYMSLGESYENIDEIITKASLIEREAKVLEERAIIAGVIENRLSIGQRLQIDASVVYAITDGMYDAKKVYYKDLEIDSGYNTYKYEGLPLGPIANPGLESIKAAINPLKHEYFYYRTDTSKNDGTHIFTKTFDEHKQ